MCLKLQSCVCVLKPDRRRSRKRSSKDERLIFSSNTKKEKRKKLRMSEGLLNNTTEGILSNYCPWRPLTVSLKQLASPGTASAGQQLGQIALCRPQPADALIKGGGEGTALLVPPLPTDGQQLAEFIKDSAISGPSKSGGSPPSSHCSKKNLPTKMNLKKQ